MYHIELRQFPHNLCRFNLTDQALRAIVEPWASEKFVEVGERKWHPEQARLTILEGPELPLQQLSMGRGWRAAQRQSEDVTQRVIAAARESAQAAAPAVAGPAVGAAGAAAGALPVPGAGAAGAIGAGAGAAGAGSMTDPLALSMQIGALLGPDAVALLDAWRAAAAGSPGLAPSESLAAAEQAVRSAGGSQG
jgi:hypothetical protein